MLDKFYLILRKRFTRYLERSKPSFEDAESENMLLRILFVYSSIMGIFVLTSTCGIAASISSCDMPVQSEDVVVKIDNFSISYDWFLHTFRSSFFRYENPETMRREAFDNFLEHMLLYRLAVKEGVAENPEVQEKIRDQVGNARAYMDYQLAMMEVNILIQAYLEKIGLTPSAFAITEEDIATYDQEKEQTSDFSPPFAEMPQEIQERVKQQLIVKKFQSAVHSVAEVSRSQIQILPAWELIDSVPLPQLVHE